MAKHIPQFFDAPNMQVLKKAIEQDKIKYPAVCLVHEPKTLVWFNIDGTYTQVVNNSLTDIGYETVPVITELDSGMYKVFGDYYMTANTPRITNRVPLMFIVNKGQSILKIDNHDITQIDVVEGGFIQDKFAKVSQLTVKAVTEDNIDSIIIRDLAANQNFYNVFKKIVTDNSTQTVTVGDTAYRQYNSNINLPAYPTTLPASDVYAWAKEENPPIVNYADVVNAPVAEMSNIDFDTEY